MPWTPPKTPYLTVDCIIRYQGGIILIQRRHPPKGWALPGGFCEVGETVEDAVIREVKEETGLDLEKLELNLSQFHAYSDPNRDPRSHTVSVVFVGDGFGKLKSGDDAKEAKVFTKDSLPLEIPFDHRQILNDYFNKKYPYSWETIGLPVEPNRKFAFLATSSWRLDNSFPEVLMLQEESPQVWVEKVCNFEIASRWQDYLGEIKMDVFKNCSFVVFASQESSNLDLLNDENEVLAKILRFLRYSFFLNGVIIQNSIQMTGSCIGHKNGTLQEIRSASIHIKDGFSHPGYINPTLNEKLMKDILATSLVLERVDSQNFKPLQRGLSSFIRAVEEIKPRERHHHFVQSLDALFNSEHGRGKNRFKSRGEYFIRTRNTHYLLGEIYNARGKVEHLKNIEDIWSDPRAERYIDGSNEDEKFMKLLFISEVMARHAYLKILNNNELINHFKDYSSINDFWTSLTSEQRLELLGEPLDIDEIMEKEYKVTRI